MASAANTEENQSAKCNQGNGVTIGDITGGIAYAVIAGGNVENVHIGNKIYNRSQLEELRDYLETAVARYDAAQMRRTRKATTQVTTTHPYKFLDWFELEDASIFFGREEATQALHQVVLQSRLTVLHAKSGAGKTSLLNAGLAPQLIEDGRLLIFARAFQDSVLAIKRAVTSSITDRSWPDLLPELNLYDFLGIICHFLAGDIQELVLVLDQFEEFFIFWPLREQRQPFIDDFARCYADKNLPLRFIIALRKDYYSDLADFEPYIPEIFRNQFRLEPLNRQQAAQAITAPVAKLGQLVTYTPDLLDVLLDDLRHNGMELPHLQIICTKLFEDALTKGAKIIDMSSYEHFGRATGILGDYLNGVLQKFPGQDGAIAKAILKELVSSESTKRVLAYTTLASRVEAKPSDLDDVLTRLVNARLLRRDEVAGEIVYEMAHEYLIAEIRQWIDPSDLVFKQVEELLEREVANWRIYKTLIPRDRLELIYAQHERLRIADDSTAECLLRSALKGGFSVAESIDLVASAGEQPLLTVLQDTDEAKRLDIIGTLQVRSQMSPPSVFIASLKDENKEVRQKAAEALGHLGAAEAIDPLIAAFKDDNEEVRRTAVRSLEQLGTIRIIDPLISALKDENEYTHAAAAELLRRLDHVAVQPLIALLNGKDERVRMRAARILGELHDDRAINPLVAILKDENEDVRFEAARSLAKFDDPRAAEPLIAALSSLSVDVRLGAAKALGQLHDNRAVVPLIAGLKDEDYRVRRTVAESLGQLGDIYAVEPLIANLQDESVSVQKTVIQALSQLRDARAIDPLLAALKDKNEDVRFEAARSLAKFGDTRIVQPFIASLDDENSQVRRIAAETLAQLGNVEPLITSLQDESVQVRKIAIEALKQVDDYPTTVEPLIASLTAALNDKNRGIRQTAVEILGQLSPDQAIEPLITAINNEMVNVRQTAIVALGRLGDARAVAPLINALTDNNVNVRMGAAKALRLIGTSEALVALKQAGFED